MAVTQPFNDEQDTQILQVRLMIGDTPTSPFYPLFQDEEIAQFLDMNGWRVRPAMRMAAIAANMQFAQFTYRERSGDIEVWNNVSLQYQKALQNIIDESSTAQLPDGMMPYFGGISWSVVDSYNANPDNVRSSLTWKGREYNAKAKNSIFLVGDNDQFYIGVWRDTAN